ncbi:DUF2459 domain-containing protein [Pleurocapsales cyanobacterium LEGE 10410]|nr:DUF2459 domain-containing protein [Pleurocapsales cyanobacterium LEGE 10410]
MNLFGHNRIFSPRLKILAFLLLFLVVVGLIVLSSPTFIIPPTAPIAPVTVYVIDYGYHSRLVLPDEEGKLMQYAYGDWRYFALNRQNFVDGIAALLYPTQGTLGRRQFNNLAEFQGQLKSDRNTLLAFEVAEAKAARLLKLLDRRFRQNLPMRVKNPRNHLTFVLDDRDYIVFHNSNHELVTWLKNLDCRVKGFVALPNFQVKVFSSPSP